MTVSKYLIRENGVNKNVGNVANAANFALSTGSGAVNPARRQPLAVGNRDV